MISVLVFLSVVTMISAGADSKYCSTPCTSYPMGYKYCSAGRYDDATDSCIKDHIGCTDNGQFQAECRGANTVKITPDIKKIFLDEHNKLRHALAGGNYSNKFGYVCRMATMKWDNEMAKLAEFNTHLCKMNHDKCRNTKKFKNSGQCLYYASGTKGYLSPDINKRIADAIKSWFDEINYTTRSQIQSYPQSSPKVISHFTVISNEENNRVGCAMATSETTYDELYWITCNYARTNMVGSPVFKTCQRPAQQCKTGTFSRYKYLCSNKENYTVNNYLGVNGNLLITS